jgi:hypothetical protein
VKEGQKGEDKRSKREKGKKENNADIKLEPYGNP